MVVPIALIILSQIKGQPIRTAKLEHSEELQHILPAGAMID